MPVPLAWTGETGHILHEPWIPQWLADGMGHVIEELENAAPLGLAERRKAFREGGKVDHSSTATGLSPIRQQDGAIEQLLEIRMELLVAVRLIRNGVQIRMRKDTPDFECAWNDLQFGIEVTTRARREVAEALHEVLERALWDGPEVHVTLTRAGRLLFSLSREDIDAAAERLVDEITRLATGEAALTRAVIPLPDLGLTANILPGNRLSGPGLRVVYQPVLTMTDLEWDYHWRIAARQIQDTITKKGRKRYELPSLVVVDVSRLGEAGRVPAGPWIDHFQQVLDGCALGNLSGVLIVRTTLTSDAIEALCWRGDKTVLPAVAAVLHHAPPPS